MTKHDQPTEMTRGDAIQSPGQITPPEAPRSTERPPPAESDTVAVTPDIRQSVHDSLDDSCHRYGDIWRAMAERDKADWLTPDKPSANKRGPDKTKRRYSPRKPTTRQPAYNPDERGNVKIHLELDASLLAAVDAEARRLNVTRKAAVTEALKNWLQK